MALTFFRYFLLVATTGSSANSLLIIRRTPADETTELRVVKHMICKTEATTSTYFPRGKQKSIKKKTETVSEKLLTRQLKPHNISVLIPDQKCFSCKKT